MTERRPAGRKADEIRPVSIDTDVNRYATGSVLIRSGETHVLCTASVENSVPRWMEGSGGGWVTAEYAMLPSATHTRGRRERDKVSGRTLEIQRLIARALRSMVDLKALGERTVIVDCDVMQADGGTRTASITGGCIALTRALKRLIAEGELPENVITNSVSAISVGLRKGEILVDLDYEEDSSCDVDMNFVMTGEGRFVEIQGTGEKTSFSREEFDRMTEAALSAGKRLREHQASSV